VLVELAQVVDLMIALREMARAKVRFGLLVGSVALLLFLIVFQQTLRNGLITSFVGAIRHQSAPVLVYSTDARRTLQSSAIPPELEARVRDVDGAAAVARLGQGTYSVRADGDVTSAAIIGYERRRLGAPQELVAGRYPRATGEVVANVTDASNGFDLGDVVRVLPAGLELRVVGQAEDTNLQASPTLFTTYDTWLRTVSASNPDARTPPPSALGVAPTRGTDPSVVVRRINSISTDLEALTRADAASEAPSVRAVSRSFLLIFLLYGLVVPLVVGLFFLILTLQKARTLTLLRAIGARSRTLVRALVLQVLIVVGLGAALAVLVYLPLSQQRIGSIPLRFDVGAVVGWTAGVLVLALASTWFSVRRVLRLEPADALGGGAQ
jgi:putative ABC transport system permease protein